jgi:hypothetical protein
MSTHIVGWAHSPSGKFARFDLEALINGVARDAIAGATGVSMQVPGASLAGVFNMAGSAVAGYVSVLERVQ